MHWSRIILDIAVIAMTVVMFVPLPLWAAVTLMIVSLATALIVLGHAAGSRQAT